MYTTSLAMGDSRIVLSHGDYDAVFLRKEDGWHPDWIYQNEQPVLRFKDHEWLSVGHLRNAAHAAEKFANNGETGVVFRGSTLYAGVTVEWSVTVSASTSESWFHIHSEMTPGDTMELMETFTAMETPYVYSGMEDALCMIGQNPITHWKDGQAIAQERYWNPQWVMTRKESARCLVPSKTPILCLRVRETTESAPVYVSLAADFNQCDFHSLYMSPTSFQDGARGYKVMAGVHNWSSAIAKDPNVLLEKGVVYRQDFYVEISQKEKDIADWYHRAYMKSIAVHFPQDGRIESYDRAKEKQATMQDGSRWLLDVFNSEGKEGLYDPEKGILFYLEGTRAKSGSWYKESLAQLMGPIGYYAYATKEQGSDAFCQRHKEDIRRLVRDNYLSLENPVFFIVPAFYYYALHKDPANYDACMQFARGAIGATVPEKNPSDVGDPGCYYKEKADNGYIAMIAEALLKIYEVYPEPWILKGIKAILRRLNADLNHRFWFFGVSNRSDLDTQSMKQIRPLGMGHAVIANVLAYETTKDEGYLDAAEQLTKILVSVCYSTFSNSSDPDFDYRGWANGTNSGRDLTAEFPPWETSESVLCAAYLAKYRVVPGLMATLWYLQRTYSAAFPAAREMKMYYDTKEKRVVRLMSEVATEKTIAQAYPFLVYECPYDQTLQSLYQGVNPILNAMTYCGELAETSDDRLLALVPGAAGYAPDIRQRREVLVYNPLGVDVQTALKVWHMDGDKVSITAKGQADCQAKLGEYSASIWTIPAGQTVAFEIQA